MPARRRVAVVGGGIAGLAAALELSAAGADVTVFEKSDRVGGKVRVSDVGGLPVDEGADAMVVRVPEGRHLAEAVGLGTELVSPATGEAGIWTRGRVRAMPTGTVMGVPGDLAALARSEVLSARGVARVPWDLVLPGAAPREDVSVGAYVAARLGREVVDRLVDPLLGGVYAGHADQLSLHATLPQLVGPVASHRSLLQAVRDVRPSGPPGSPVFQGLPGGMGRLPAAVAAVAAASGAALRLGSTVRGLSRRPDGWRLELGSAAAPEAYDVDAVVLAVPAGPAARLLRPVDAAAAEGLASIAYASMAIVTLVLAGPPPGRGSGYLVPAVEGRLTKAVTFASRKWAHYSTSGGSDRAVVRCSVGRFGGEADLQRDDAELVAGVLAELQAAVGPVPPLVDSRVTRWGGGLPQYAPGHLELVGRIKAAVARHPGLAVAGAAYGGVGVPACARSGREAARAVLQAEWTHD